MMKIKTLLKNQGRYLFGKSIDSVYKLLDEKISVVSFDMFDTLVFRNCPSPQDIFRAVELKYNETYKVTCFDFHTHRICAEQAARKKKKEVTLRDIYSEITDVDCETREKLYELELKTEIDFCFVNHEMKKIYDATIQMGKKVIITTDMYLPMSTIKAILDKCGIRGYGNVYLSCEQNASKRQGELFSIILKDNNISPDSLLHIGDHMISDYFKPKNLGIHAFLYKRCDDLIKLSEKSDFNLSEYDEFQCKLLYSVGRNISIDKSLEYSVGARILGPILFGYCKWLHQHVTELHDANIVFLAREGKIIKEAYELIYGNNPEKLFYVNVSRLAVCRSFTAETNSYDELMSLYKSLLRGIETAEDLFKLCLGSSQGLDTLLKGKRLDDLYSDEKDKLFNSIVKENQNYFEEQNSLIERYLLDNGFSADCIAISDIGWSGTMQLYLTKMFPEKEINGYYLAVSNVHDEEQYNRMTREGFWCNADEWASRGIAFRFTQSAIETLFMSIEGTTLGYAVEGDKVVPIKSDKSWDQHVLCLLDELDSGALDFVRQYLMSYICKTDEDVLAEVFFYSYIDFVACPQKRTCEFYKKFSFEDGKNNVGFTPVHGLFYYLINFEQLKKELETNNSKVIWLKALFKIPFPYYKFLAFLTGSLKLKSNYSRKHFDGKSKEFIAE